MSNEELPSVGDLDEIEAPELITLEYEDGTSERCEVVDVFGFEGVDYVALAPESDDEVVYLYGYDEHDDGTFSLRDILDDDEFASASAAFEQLAEEE